MSRSVRVAEPASFQRAPTADIAKQSVPACPACDSSARRQILTVQEHEYTTTTTDRFPMMACEDCGAWYLDPRPDVSALDVIYPPNYYAYVLDAPEDSQGETRGAFNPLAVRAYQRRMAPIARHVELGPETRWFEIGCGNGFTLDWLREAFGVRAAGLDMSAGAVEACRRRGYTAHASRLEDYQPGPDERYDVLHSSHVIEHLESPRAYMEKAWELLAPGGINAFLTPNTATWEARRFGRHWGGLHVPRHWALLDEASARRLGESVGFEFLEARYSSIGTFWTWTCHSLLLPYLPRRLCDAVFPSDHRFVKVGPWGVLRLGLFTVFDILNVLLTRQSANMLVLFRKPGGG